MFYRPVGDSSIFRRRRSRQSVVFFQKCDWGMWTMERVNCECIGTLLVCSLAMQIKALFSNNKESTHLPLCTHCSLLQLSVFTSANTLRSDIFCTLELALISLRTSTDTSSWVCHLSLNSCKCFDFELNLQAFCTDLLFSLFQCYKQQLQLIFLWLLRQFKSVHMEKGWDKDLSLRGVHSTGWPTGVLW